MTPNDASTTTGDPFDADRTPAALAASSEVAGGWLPIVEDLIGELLVVAPDIEFLQIKQKFADLRVYHAANLDSDDDGVRRAIIEALIAVAAERCARTCETCGAPGRRRTASYWMSVSCASCAQTAGRAASTVTAAEEELVELLGASAAPAIATALRSARSSARTAAETIDRLDATRLAGTSGDTEMWLTVGRPANIDRLIDARAVLAAFGESTDIIDSDLARFATAAGAVTSSGPHTS